ncbi:MAG: hypothetical protein HQK58_02805 [Deltaproteobacteria bacterium]|nr:hypothetical protein [Deltaproteobacteria bacterium]
MKRKLGTKLEDLLRQKNEPIPKELQKKLDKERAADFFTQGVELLKQGSYMDSLPPLFTALTLDPKLVKASNNLAAAFWKLECPTLAVEMVRRTLSVDPDNRIAQKHLDLMLTEDNELDHNS